MRMLTKFGNRFYTGEYNYENQENLRVFGRVVWLLR